jgi:hypothetical protein
MDDPDAREVWLVRHGETEWSRDGRHTSTTDLPLTDVGRRVAETLSDRLDDDRFDLVLTSPRQRAGETACLAGHADAEVDDDLAEWDYGDLEGLTTEQIRTTYPDWTIWSGPGRGVGAAGPGGRALSRGRRPGAAVRPRALAPGVGGAVVGAPGVRRAPPAARHRDRVGARLGARDAGRAALELLTREADGP